MVLRILKRAVDISKENELDISLKEKKRVNILVHNLLLKAVTQADNILEKISPEKTRRLYRLIERLVALIKISETGEIIKPSAIKDIVEFAETVKFNELKELKLENA